MPASRGLWPASEGVDFAAKSVVLLGQALLSGFRAFGTLLLFKSAAVFCSRTLLLFKCPLVFLVGQALGRLTPF